MVKFKTFYGNLSEPVDELINRWLRKHPEVDIISYKYSLGTSFNQFVSSICIMYREV